MLVLAQWEGQDDQITLSSTEEAIMVSQQGMAWAKPSHMVLMIHGIELNCFLRTSTATIIFANINKKVPKYKRAIQLFRIAQDDIVIFYFHFKHILYEVSCYSKPNDLIVIV